MNLTTEQQEWLYALQRPWPLVSQPLTVLAKSLGTSTEALVSFISDLRTQGLVRRIGGVFDARRLGYRSCLYAISAPEPAILATAAGAVSAHPGVTHAYIRGWPEGFSHPSVTATDYEAYPNLWFTLSAPSATFEAEAASFAAFSPIPFPALTRYKIDVVFDPRTRQRDERTEYLSTKTLSESPQLSSVQQAIVRRYQDDTANLFTPFTEDDLPQLRAWQADGTLRRFALLLYHRVSGFAANGMCCWQVPQEELDLFGRRLAAFPEVTHCYARPAHASFPFTLYAMIHKTSWQEAMNTFDHLTQTCGLSGHPRKIFFSTHEYKKSSLRFFI